MIRSCDVVRSAIVQALIDAQAKNEAMAAEVAAAKRSVEIETRRANECIRLAEARAKAKRRGLRSVSVMLGRAVLLRQWPNGEPMDDRTVDQLQRFVDPIHGRLLRAGDACPEWREGG